jgi:hypothetical protein
MAPADGAGSDLPPIDIPRPSFTITPSTPIVSPGLDPSNQPGPPARPVDCKWNLKTIRPRVIEGMYRDMHTTAYYGQHADLSPMLDAHGRPSLVSGSGAGNFDAGYDSATRSLIATVRIEVQLKDIHRLDPTTKQPVLDENGQPRSVPYESLKNGLGVPKGQGDPNIVLVDRPSTTFDFAAHKQAIETTLNQNNYQLTLDGCPQGSACGCRVPVQFVVELLLKGAKSAGKPHSSVRLFPQMERADSSSWGEVEVWWDKRLGKHVPQLVWCLKNKLN